MKTTLAGARPPSPNVPNRFSEVVRDGQYRSSEAPIRQGELTRKAASPQHAADAIGQARTSQAPSATKSAQSTKTSRLPTSVGTRETANRSRLRPRPRAA